MIELVNEFGREWAAYFGIAVVQNTVFLGLVFLFLHLARNAPARLKYSIGLFGLFKLLLPPFIPTGMLAYSPITASYSPLTSIGFPFASSPLTTESTGSSAPVLSLIGFVFITWIVLVLVYIGYSLYLTLRLRLKLRCARKLQSTFEVGRSDLPKTRLFKSEAIVMPLTVGIFPKRIYVPAAWDQWSENCREMVIRHESAHIKRFDGFFQILQIIAQALYFFHPLVWLLNRRLNAYREMACDDASLANDSGSPVEYSKILVEIAETITRDPLTCKTVSALIRRKNELLHRVIYQMKEGAMKRVSKPKAAALLISLALLTVSFSWYQGGASPTKATIEDKTTKSNPGQSIQNINVSLDEKNGMRINGELVSFEEFIERMETIAQSDRDNIVVNLNFDSDMPMVKLSTVHVLLKRLNLTKVSYHSDINKAVPLVLPNEKIEQRIKTIPKTDIVDVRMTESGEVYFGNKEVPMKDVSKHVKKLLAENEWLIVSIHFDKRTKYRDYVALLNQAKKGDARRIFINHPAE